MTHPSHELMENRSSLLMFSVILVPVGESVAATANPHHDTVDL